MLFTRIRAALTAPPAAWHARPFLIEFGWLLPVLLAIGFAGGLMRWAPALDGRTLQLAFIAILAPALGEELLFRAALLPRPHSGPLPWPPVLLSTALFVLWHPLQAPFFGPDWARLMLDPWFLAAVAALGIAAARLYWRTASLWPSVFLHWLVVVGWKAFLGGPTP